MEFKERLDVLVRKEQVLNAVTCAVIIHGLRQGLNPYQVEVAGHESSLGIKAFSKTNDIYHLRFRMAFAVLC